MTSFAIRRAEAADVDALAPLFNAYRRFYEQPADLDRARAFLQARLAQGESVVFVAEAPPASGAARVVDADGDGVLGPTAQALGFCQLYPTWCSVAAAPIFVLYDLFVDDGARRLGVARALMLAAQGHARAAGAARIDLSTARENTRAQALYESLGWQRDEVFLSYGFALAP